jgi:hypothetical protein
MFYFKLEKKFIQRVNFPDISFTLENNYYIANFPMLYVILEFFGADDTLVFPD